MPYSDKEKQIEFQKKYRLENKEKTKIYNKKYKEILKPKIKKNIKEYQKNYYQNNKEKIQEYYSINKDKTKEYNRFYSKNRREIDYLYRLRCSISCLIRSSIKNQGHSKKSKTFKILGCASVEFKQHLERQFKKGMNWDNIGQWHLDHIYPASLAKDENELLKLNHYTNFQPMWAAENISKGNKIIPNTQIKLI